MIDTVMFYLQPHTIRNNGLTFAWVFHEYLSMAKGLASLGIRSVFMVDDQIKQDYSQTWQHIYSPADFGIRFDTGNWPAYWRDILTDPTIPDKTRLLEALYQKHQFQWVFCWTYDATLERFCREKNCTILFQELGMIRRPLLYQMDFEGLLWKSSMVRLFHKYRSRIKTDHARLRRFLDDMKKLPNVGREEIIQGLGLDERKPILLILLQVEDDSNIVVGSPFRSMQEYLNYCFVNIKDIGEYNVLIRKHPGQPDVALDVEGLTTGRFRRSWLVSNEYDNLSLIQAADYLFTINSSAGFEGLCYGKNVVTFGRSPYHEAGFTLHLETDKEYTFSSSAVFFKDLYEEKREEINAFLHFALFHYQFPGHLIFLPEFYQNVFDKMQSTNDKEDVFLREQDDSLPMLKAAVNYYEHRTEEKVREIRKIERYAHTLEEAITEHEQSIRRLTLDRDQKAEEILRIRNTIENSRIMRLASHYYQMRERVLPEDGWRRRVLQGVARVVRSLLRILLAPCAFAASRLRDPYAPWRRTLAVLFPALADAPYQHWLKQNRYTRGQLDAQRHSDQAAGPLVSLVVAPSHAGRNDWQSFLSALQQQTYLKWEACLALAEGEEQVVERAAKQDPRIRLIPVERTSDWALQANTAAGAASGGHLALLDPEDMLPPYALYEVAAAIQANPRAEIFYADEDQITRNGRRRFAPHFKPDFSPDTLRSFNYIRRLSAVRRELWERLGGLRPGFGGQCEYDFILRATENAGQIVHIPKILRHRRAPLRLDGEEAGASVSRALQEHLRRMGSNAEIRKGLTAGTYQVVYPVVGDPLVSVIIPTRDHLGELRTCLEGLLTKTDYRRLEILLLENHSTAPEVFRYYDEVRRNHDRVKILEWKAPFNYSAINNWAVRQARGEVLLFMNNDMEVIHGDWLTQLLGQALRPDVGAVGAKLLLADGSIQHAGIVYGTLPDGQGFAGHVCAFADGRQPGNFGRLQTVQNVSAVTGACLMLRKTVFAEAGGFDEAFPIAYGDLDLCLQIRRLGYAIIWTPFAALYHLESRTRGSDSQNSDARRRSLGELQRLKEKWQDTLMRGDPYYNPHLRLEQCDYSVRIT